MATAQPVESALPISDALRRAILAMIGDGESLYALATATKVDVGTLGRFVRGECGLRLEAIDRLFAVLGLGVIREPNDAPQAPSFALRSWIVADQRNIFALSIASGVAHTTITKFLNGRAGFELVSVDKLAAALGLRIVQGDRPSIVPPARPGDDQRPIFDAILAEIEAQRIDLVDLARHSGVRKDHLERLVTRNGNAKLATIDRVCEALAIGFIWKPSEPPAVPSVSIRKGIEASGLGLRKIGQLSGVVYPAIQGFMSGVLGLELVSADRIAAALGLVAARGAVARPADPPRPANPSIPYIDGLRVKLKECGLSVYAISKGSGLAQPTIARLLKGGYDIVPASLAKLARFIGFDPATKAPAPVAKGDPWADWNRSICPVEIRDDGQLVVFSHLKKRLKSEARIRLVKQLVARYPHSGGFSLPGLSREFGRGARQAFYEIKRIDADCEAAFQPATEKKDSLYRIGAPHRS